MRTKALILYASWTGNTKIVARSIAAGLRKKGVEIKVENIKKTTLKEIESCNILALGSATHGGKTLRSVKSLFEKIPKGALKDKIGASFAVQAGWGGDKVIKEIKEYFLKKRIDKVELGPIISAGIPFLPIRRPTEDDLKKCERFGEKLAVGK